MEDDVLVAGGGKWWHQRERRDEPPALPEFPEPIEAVQERIAKVIGKVTVRRSVQTWHPVIDALLRDDERRREQLRTDPYPMPWNKPRYDSPLQRRRLRILNSLFHTVSKLNGVASPREDKEGHFYVTFHHRNVGVTLVPSRQPRRRIQRGGEAGESPEPGLTLSILESFQSESARFTWCDDDNSKLEDHITEIAVHTVLAAEIQYRKGAFDHYEWQVKYRAQKEEEERQRRINAEQAERERLQQIEKDRIDGLLRDAAAFQQADQIRRYVEAIRSRLQAADSLPSPEFDLWSHWALANADRIDPALNETYLTGMRAGSRAEM
jgi:hypothetical protein